MIYFSIMNKEVPFFKPNSGGQSEINPGMLRPVEQLVDCMTDLQYELMRAERTPNNKCELNFVRRVKTKSDYPRFHIRFALPIHLPEPKITTFHLDEEAHEISMDVWKKENESKRIIKLLKRKEESEMRDRLLDQFKSKLVKQASPEINRPKDVRKRKEFMKAVRNFAEYPLGKRYGLIKNRLSDLERLSEAELI